MRIDRTSILFAEDGLNVLDSKPDNFIDLIPRYTSVGIGVKPETMKKKVICKLRFGDWLT